MSLRNALQTRLERLRNAGRALRFSLGGRRFIAQSFPDSVLKDALGGSRSRSDISDHLSELCFCTLDSPPDLIVELGTRGGESTRALLAAAQIAQRPILSIDINPCAPADLPHTKRWNFIQADDVNFGRTQFRDWCKAADLPARIGTLFIDTSHEYEHTREEIDAWFPHLATGANVIFHDTNMGKGTYARMDGSIGHGWNNQRGVIRALEEYLGRHYDETTHFTDCTDTFLVRHIPYCNGLTILRKYSNR